MFCQQENASLASYFAGEKENLEAREVVREHIKAYGESLEREAKDDHLLAPMPSAASPPITRPLKDATPAAPKTVAAAIADTPQSIA